MAERRIEIVDGYTKRASRLIMRASRWFDSNVTPILLRGIKLLGGMHGYDGMLWMAGKVAGGHRSHLARPLALSSHFSPSKQQCYAWRRAAVSLQPAPHQISLPAWLAASCTLFKH